MISKIRFMILAFFFLPMVCAGLSEKNELEPYSLIYKTTENLIKEKILKNHFYHTLTDDIVNVLKLKAGAFPQKTSDQVFPLIYDLTPDLKSELKSGEMQKKFKLEAKQKELSEYFSSHLIGKKELRKPLESIKEENEEGDIDHQGLLELEKGLDQSEASTHSSPDDNLLDDMHVEKKFLRQEGESFQTRKKRTP
jgi:hypothetical protein